MGEHRAGQGLLPDKKVLSFYQENGAEGALKRLAVQADEALRRKVRTIAKKPERRKQMETTITTSISLQKTLFEQAESLAQQLNISPSHLFERAVEDFIRRYQSSTPLSEESYQNAKKAEQISGGRRVIHQGDIYWVHLENPGELETAIPHPYVVIQDDLFNHSRIDTVVACALTSNIRRVSDTPGNLLLDVGEANLPKRSVVEVSKVSTVEKAQLGDYIGSLTERRIQQILAGMRFLQMSYFTR
jgi:mRNA interferase MazF